MMSATREKNGLINTPSRGTDSGADSALSEKLAHRPAYHDGETALSGIAKIAGRKQLAYDLRISKSLLDQMLSGEKLDPIVRARRIVMAAVKYLGEAAALNIGRQLMRDLDAAVITSEQLRVIKEIIAENE